MNLVVQVWVQERGRGGRLYEPAVFWTLELELSAAPWVRGWTRRAGPPPGWLLPQSRRVVPFASREYVMSLARPVFVPQWLEMVADWARVLDQGALRVEIAGIADEVEPAP